MNLKATEGRLTGQIVRRVVEELGNPEVFFLKEWVAAVQVVAERDFHDDGEFMERHYARKHADVYRAVKALRRCGYAQTEPRSSRWRAGWAFDLCLPGTHAFAFRDLGVAFVRRLDLSLGERRALAAEHGARLIRQRAGATAATLMVRASPTSPKQGPGAADGRWL